MKLKPSDLRKWLFLGLEGFIILAFVNHLICTGLYLMPPNPLKNVLAKPVQAYMRPFFYQNWHLFSPSPGASYVRLEVSCGLLNRSVMPWSDPLQQVQKSHELFRVTGLGKSLQYRRQLGEKLFEKLQLQFQSCKAQGGADLDCRVAALAHVEKSSEYLRAKKYAVDYCQSKSNFHDTTQMRLSRYNPVPYSKRNQEKPGTREVFYFPLSTDRSSSKAMTPHSGGRYAKF